MRVEVTDTVQNCSGSSWHLEFDVITVVTGFDAVSGTLTHVGVRGRGTWFSGWPRSTSTPPRCCGPDT